MILIMKGLNFLFQKKIIVELKDKTTFALMYFVMKNGLTYPVYVSDQKFHNSMDLLLILNENKSHYVYIKDFNRFMCNKTKNKNEKYFCKCCLQCFCCQNFLIEHKENCLIINGKQSVKLKIGSISFKNYFKQLPVPFKIYADFECILKGIKIGDKNNGSYTEKYQAHIPCSFTYKVVCVDNKFSKRVVLYRGKMLFIGLLKQFLMSMIIVKKMIKRHFDKKSCYVCRRRGKISIK